VILDGSEAADEHWSSMVRLARGVINEAPAGTGVSVYLLGNPKAQSREALSGDAPGVRAESRGRVRLIGPICRQWKPGDAVTALVLGAGPIHDMDDWLGAVPSIAAVHFVQFGAAPPAPDPRCRPEPAGRAEPAPLAGRLYLRREGIELTGRGLCPFFWDNPHYEWDARGGRLFTADGDEVMVRVGFFRPRDAEFQVRARLSSGAIVPLNWDSCEPPPDSSPVDPSGEWHDLDDGDAAVFRQYLARQDFRCPRCGQTHRFDTVHCPNLSGGYLPMPEESVYSALDDRRSPGAKAGFVVLHADGERVRFRVHPWPALRLGAGELAIRSKGNVEVHQYDVSSDRWDVRTDAVGRYYLLEGGPHALAL
jgi:hypothetical protein